MELEPDEDGVVERGVQLPVACAVEADRSWWGGLWANRALHSDFAKQAVTGGFADREALQAIAAAWQRWAVDPEGWLMIPHGQILARA